MIYRYCTHEQVKRFLYLAGRVFVLFAEDANLKHRPEMELRPKRTGTPASRHIVLLEEGLSEAGTS